MVVPSGIPLFHPSPACLSNSCYLPSPTGHGSAPGFRVMTAGQPAACQRSHVKDWPAGLSGRIFFLVTQLDYTPSPTTVGCGPMPELQPGGSQPGRCCPPGDTWQCLETSLAVTITGGERGQGTSHSRQPLTTQNLPAGGGQ